MSPPVYNYFNGKLIIDFDENNIKPNENGVDSVKIEVINKLGKPLSHVNGISILTCQNFDGKIQSKVFKLEGGYNFLGDDGHAEFFLSPDPLFVNLVSSRNHKCVDAYFIDAKYHKINKSYAKLEKVTTYDFFINESGDYKIVNSRLNNIDYITKHKCTKCNITIKIFSQNHKPETHKESHKFVGSSITIPPFEKEIFLNDGDDYSEVFSKSLIGYYIPGTNATELCKKIKERFNIGINCNQHMGGFRIPSLPFYRTKIASIEEGQSSRVIQIDYITE